MKTDIVTIDLDERSYDIYIGDGLLHGVEQYVPFDVEGGRFFLIADENTEGFAKNIETGLSAAGAKQVEGLVLPAGEATKSFENYQKTCEWLLSHQPERKSAVFAIGGGVIGDLGGFTAASVLRGLPYIQIPTSLLAQVDSSVGGKTGINAPQGKNLIGAFYQPRAVIADLDTLKTLPKRELLAGYSEIVKYGLLEDYAFFEWLEANGKAVLDLSENELAEAIQKSVEAKTKIVRADEREAGRRALLNLGHTFGHALEAAAGYDGTLLHGEAVAIGMVSAFDLSARMELCTTGEMERVENHLLAMGLPTRASMIEGLNTSIDEQIRLMQGDKKVADGKVTFVLVNEIGNAFTTSDVPDDLLRAVLKDSLGGKTLTSKSNAASARSKTRSGLINQSFTNKGVHGLWKSVFSSQSSRS